MKKKDVRALPEADRAMCAEIAATFGVTGAIHPADHIFWFIYDHRSFREKREAIVNYFETGAKSADNLAALVGELRGPGRFRLFEFASGFGCMTRHLKKRVSEAQVVACDIHKEAVPFLRRKIGVGAKRSSDVPEKLRMLRKSDVVLAVSFFSHMPKETWTRWLAALARQVRPGGLLMFTTHGQTSMPLTGAKELDDDGFWFIPQSEQHDLKGAVYGSTVTSEAYVRRQIETIPEMKLKQFKPGFWFKHQDLYVLERAN